jgi:hypothetical protein
MLYFPKIYNHTPLYGPTASFASVNPPQVMLVLPIVENWKVWC